jgi:cell division septation protein DedD
MRWGRPWNGFGYTELVMEDRIKQRLTGAAIVVALLVVLVPEMFRGRPPAAPAPTGGAAAGPPVRSYTIELRDGAPGAATPGAGAVTSDQPALAAPAEQIPPAASAGAPAAAQGAAAAAPGQAASAAPAAAAATMPAPASAVAAPTAAAPTPAAAAPATSDSSPGADRYQVQLGLFASRANADRLTARVVKQGIKVSVSGPDARGLFRVHTPTYATREEAQAIQQKLRELGLTAALTPQR